MRNTARWILVLTALFGFAFAASVEAAAMTVTGCLGKGHEEGEFQLTHATGGDAIRYDLIAGKGVDLRSHLGHKVEITGEKATEAKETAGAAGAKKEPPREHLKVMSMKHIAAECP
jgi:hypothetical protein